MLNGFEPSGVAAFHHCKSHANSSLQEICQWSHYQQEFHCQEGRFPVFGGISRSKASYFVIHDAVPTIFVAINALIIEIFSRMFCRVESSFIKTSQFQIASFITWTSVFHCDSCTARRKEQRTSRCLVLFLETPTGIHCAVTRQISINPCPTLELSYTGASTRLQKVRMKPLALELCKVEDTS